MGSQLPEVPVDFDSRLSEAAADGKSPSQVSSSKPKPAVFTSSVLLDAGALATADRRRSSKIQGGCVWADSRCAVSSGGHHVSRRPSTPGLVLKDR